MHTQQTACALIKNFLDDKFTPTQYLQDLFDYIEKTDAKLNALTSLQKTAALEKAAQLEKIPPSRRPNYSMYGVPVIIKENIQKIGYPVECASNVLKGYKGEFDATVITSLEKAGAIIIATANMDEFAMGSSNEHSSHGPVKNPHDLSKVSGGSSGGSAAACAAGFAPVTLGSETGGSVRVPAGFCGVYGFKPSYGRVSRYGLIPFSSSLDQISPFTRSIDDLDLVMSIIGHSDPHDKTSLPGRYKSQLKKITPAGKKIGIPRHFLQTGIDENVQHEFHLQEQKLKKQGVKVVEIKLNYLEQVLSVYSAITCAEAARYLARFDAVSKETKQGFGDEVKRRIKYGNFVLKPENYRDHYEKAQAIRALITQEFVTLFKKVDFIYLPTAPSSAFSFGEHAKDPMKEQLYDIFTIPANLAGLPAISIPAMVRKNELPVGLQFIGAKGQDAQLIAFVANLIT